MASCNVLAAAIRIRQDRRFEIGAVFVGKMQYSGEIGIQISLAAPEVGESPA